MVTTYFLRERKEGNLLADSTILRIMDRKTILVGTNYGCVYISRQDAVRVLREYRRRSNEPFMWNGKPISTYEYEKTVTA